MIETPMDISTIKESLPTYNAVDEVLSDLRLIWTNCKTFNEAGSEITGWADSLSVSLEDLIEVRHIQFRLVL